MPDEAGQPRRPNPYDVSRPYAALMRLALALALLPGFGVGLLLVLQYGAGLPLALPGPQLAQGHGQVQLLGFTTLFVMAVGLQLFPRFLAAPIPHSDRVLLGGTLVGLAVVARLLAQPLPSSPARSAALAAAALLAPAGVLLALAAFRQVRRRSIQPLLGPAAAWQYFVGLGVVSLVAALALHAWLLLALAEGASVAPLGPDEALIHLELNGFATCLVLGVASRVFGRFLILRGHPALDRLFPWLVGVYALGLGLAVAGWLVEGWGPPAAAVRLAGYAAELGAVLAWLWLIGLYHPPARESGTPYVTNPTRRWIRVAFAFWVVGQALLAGLSAREALQGVAPAATMLSAARHAVAQGFLLVLMAAMAARLLPVYSADVLKRRWLLELLVDLLLAGAFLRVAAELLGGYAGPSGPLAALGGALSTLGFTLFALGLWRSLGRLPGARAAERPDEPRLPMLQRRDLGGHL